jgi:hypothetical protein
MRSPLWRQLLVEVCQRPEGDTLPACGRRASLRSPAEHLFAIMQVFLTQQAFFVLMTAQSINA